jgi:hypothetical protein
MESVSELWVCEQKRLVYINIDTVMRLVRLEIGLGLTFTRLYPKTCLIVDRSLFCRQQI